jgi:hypothetical protein
MLAFYFLTALLPWLDTPACEAAWNSYWHGQVLRRFLAGVTAVVMFATAMPARAQVLGTGLLQVDDEKGWWQHAVEYCQTGYRFVWEENDSMQKMIRDAGLAYKAYKQSISLYNRLSNMNVCANLMNALPVLETDTPWGPGQTEVVTIRPVFRARERLASTFHPSFGIQSFNWNNLDFDVDRSTVSSGNPNSNMTPQQLQTQAVSDGWSSWVLSQQRAGLAADSLAGPSNAPYSQLAGTIQDRYMTEMNNLQNICQNCLQAYGEGSVQYQQAIQAYSTLLNNVTCDVPSTETASLLTSLQTLDSDAQVLMEKYSTAALSMGLAAQRADAMTKNNRAIANQYDSKDLVTKFEDFLGATALLQTIAAIDGDPSNKTMSKEPLGNQQKQSNLQQDIASSAQEQLKHQMKGQMEEAQQKMIAIAQQKQNLLNAYNGENAARLQVQNQKLALIQADLAARALAIQLAAVKLPPGTVQVVPDNLVALIPGAQPASANPDGGVARNIATAANAATTQASADLGKALVGIASGCGLGFLRPLGIGFGKAWSSLVGGTFDLTSIGLGPATGGSNA